ncbi:MAG: LicD family protein [Fusobacterium sp.]|nr:LicD family protein [Fusobacterium sp.]
MEFQHKNHKYQTFPHSTYFPLREITFEDSKFYCVNKPEKFLGEIFGNYMSWPKKLYTHHFRFAKNKTLIDYYGKEQYEELKKFLNKSQEELEKI